jgi:glycosyltransferase involved in cell wall biosynthesis
MNNPSITVCILTYNRVNYLQKTINSALSQKYKNKTILVLDDCSTDDTKALLNKIAKDNKDVSFISNEINLGLSANFSKAINFVTTDLVLFIGDDDIFINDEGLDYYVKAFALSNVGVVRSRQILFNASGIKQISPITDDKKFQIFESAYDSYENFVFESISIAGLAFKIDDTINYKTAKFHTLYPQYSLTAKVALTHRTVQINEYLIGIRSHSGQLNVMSYKLNGYPESIFNDMENIFYDVRSYAISINSAYVPNKQDSIYKIFHFLPILFPQNTVSFDHVHTLMHVFSLMKHCPKEIMSVRTLMLCMLAMLPKSLLLKVKDAANDYNLKRMKSIAQSKSIKDRITLGM